MTGMPEGTERDAPTAANRRHLPPEPCEEPTQPSPKPSDARRAVTPVARTESAQGPTIHTVVMDNRTTDLFNLIDGDVKRRVDEFRLVFVAAQEDAIRQAYLRGVRDGFQQGALAASEADRG